MVGSLLPFLLECLPAYAHEEPEENPPAAYGGVFNIHQITDYTTLPRCTTEGGMKFSSTRTSYILTCCLVGIEPAWLEKSRPGLPNRACPNQPGPLTPGGGAHAGVNLSPSIPILP